WWYVGDGADPAAGVAVREAQPEPDFWLLEGSRLEEPLRTPVVYESSVVPGAVLHAATRAWLQRWFDTTGRTLRPGDTLLLYVTDHGTRNAEDPTNNAITLWGSGERLPVKDLAGMLSTLDPGVRVVALMSQCYSGGFAGLARARSSGDLPDGSTCGYFSSTGDRPAYGCYPENRGRDNVGHSFHFIETLARGGDFPGAHEEVLVRDASPDVPLRTSDVFLADVLGRAATAQHTDATAFMDAILREAWTDAVPFVTLQRVRVRGVARAARARPAGGARPGSRRPAARAAQGLADRAGLGRPRQPGPLPRPRRRLEDPHRGSGPACAAPRRGSRADGAAGA